VILFYFGNVRVIIDFGTMLIGAEGGRELGKGIVRSVNQQVKKQNSKIREKED